jgi:hypothetical protein
VELTARQNSLSGLRWRPVEKDTGKAWRGIAALLTLSSR